MRLKLISLLFISKVVYRPSFIFTVEICGKTEYLQNIDAIFGIS